VPRHFAAQEYIFDMLPAAPSIISLPTSHAQAPTHHGAANPQQQQPELSFQQLQQYLADVVSKIMDENKKKV
jgi:hypothetical protein